ncbi:MAG TPA: type IV secretory system conjugative DNA transfer family protein [Acetobacteraceae bacterium]|nr:type IV secretory system conjugative DNA transfer family protein [Acetobacteraceae bacterium]
MIQRAGYDLLRVAVRVAVQLWPLWLFWFVWTLFDNLWRNVLLTFTDPSTQTYFLAWYVWPAVSLAGPILLMVAAIVAFRLGLATRLMPFAGIGGVALATVLTAGPEYQRLAADVGVAPLLDVLRSVNLSAVLAGGVGLIAVVLGVRLTVLPATALRGHAAPRLVRGRSDNFGHADWLAIRDARRLFAGPDPAYGGIVVGEAYRVDQDRVAQRAFDPSDRGTWGQGGSAPLLIDACRSGSTHALVFAGPGGFKTTSVGIPTMLTWTGAAVVLDPSREIGPMVQAFRRQLGHRVVTLDPAATASGAFNVLDWIDIAAPDAETNVEATVNWICGETRGQVTSGAEFFGESGKALIACLLADMLWDATIPPGQRTLRQLRRILVTPEGEMRATLERIHASSASPLARDLAGTLKGLVPETFSGIYGNANKDTRWLSTAAYADLVSGNSFRTRDLADGRLTVFVQVPLKTLQATPALGRVIIGALLNAAYEADGRISGRILFLLDEVARLGYMGVLEQARDAGRKYGITLLLLYQSLGQLIGQWGREGKQAWYDATSWRLFASVQDPDTAKELSAMCGDYAVVATAEGNNAGSQSRSGAAFRSSSSGWSENRSEIRRALIKPEEIIQDTRADEAFVLLRGARPLRCGRAIYFRRQDMAPLVAANRFHGQRHAAE